MTPKKLIKKIGKCEFELAFAEKNGIKKIVSLYISEKRKLIILRAPHSAEGADLERLDNQDRKADI